MTAKATGTTVAANGARRSPLANEDGMLLVITMVILLVVSTLAAANLINAFLERSLAQNQNNASVALNAADGGIQDGFAWVNTDANVASIPTAPNPWTRPGDPVTRTGLASGASYTLSLGFKRDAEDQDCDGNTDDVVIFNKGGLGAPCPHDGLFLFPGARFSGAPGEEAGYPVITINAKGYLGTLAANRGYREIEMDVARNKFQAQVEGAFTARSGVTASGASSTDGRNHDLAGDLVGGGGIGCMADKPGITYDEGITPSETCLGNTNVQGNPCVANYDPAARNPPRALAKTAAGVLGLSEEEFEAEFVKKIDSQVDMTECYPTQHNVWFAGAGGARFNNLSPCTHYAGTIVIHNEGFDPDRWEEYSDPDDPPCSATIQHNCYDAAYATNPANQPAVFDMNGNVQWTGIVIADQVVKVNGTPTILGGIISLASGGVIESDITGTITILYSCEAVQDAVNQRYKTRLGWHRLR